MSEKPFLQLGTGTEKGILGSRRMGRKQENQNSFPTVWGGNGKKPNGNSRGLGWERKISNINPEIWEKHRKFNKYNLILFFQIFF